MGVGGVILDGQSGVLILEEGGKINHQCFKYIYTICICITGTRISSQFTFIVYGIHIVYDGERQVTKPSFPLQSCRSRTEFL